MGTLVEYEHLDAAGHDLCISAEGDGNPFCAPVVIGVANLVWGPEGEELQELCFTAAGARDFAASLLLAADAADRGKAL